MSEGDRATVELARQACRQLQRCEYLAAARSLTALRSRPAPTDPPTAVAVERFATQASRYLHGIAVVFASPALAAELTLR